MMEGDIIKDENTTVEEDSTVSETTEPTNEENTEEVKDAEEVTEDETSVEDEDSDVDDDVLIEDDAEDLEDDDHDDAEEDKTVPNITLGTIIRTILLAIGIVNLILTSTGHSPLPFDSDDVNMAISAIYQAVVSVIAWWKDNDFTVKARLRKVEK